ncbi:MAG: hypothetical protein IJY46_00385 [Lentisphaeria bacterium]|nr:hypothetical protein [Lentisphaeria bacterium]
MCDIVKCFLGVLIFFYEKNHSCPIRNDLRRRLVGNLTGKSADSGSVEGVSPRPRRCLDLPATLLHDPSAGHEQTILNAAPLVARRMAHARFAYAKQNLTKSLFPTPIFFL